MKKKQKRIMIVILTCILLVSLFIPSISADSILISQTEHNNGWIAKTDYEYLAQSITIPSGQTSITKIEIYGNCITNETFHLGISKVRTTWQGGWEYSESLDGNELNGWLEIDFDDIDVNESDTIYIMLRGYFTVEVEWRSSNNNPYSGGVAYGCPDAISSWEIISTDDFCFRVYGNGTGGSSSGFATDNTMTYIIIAVVAAIAIGAVIYFGPTMKKGGRKKK